jgi:hypothetical protein
MAVVEQEPQRLAANSEKKRALKRATSAWCSGDHFGRRRSAPAASVIAANRAATSASLSSSRYQIAGVADSASQHATSEVLPAPGRPITHVSGWACTASPRARSCAPRRRCRATRGAWSLYDEAEAGTVGDDAVEHATLAAADRPRLAGNSVLVH